MGVPAAGNCCCGKCCKPKDWRFNYPYYVQGTPNPWKGDGRPLDPDVFKLVDWSKNGRWSIIANFPDGKDCDPDDPGDGKTRIIQGSALKAVTNSEITAFGINITVRANVPITLLIVITPCGKSGGIADDDHPYVYAGVYRREWTVGTSGLVNGYGYDPLLPCTDYTATLKDATRFKIGPSKINVYAQKINWIGKANATITFQNLNAENECK